MHNTGNDIESNDILDFEDNCVNLDVLMNADQEYWTDRLGNKRPTIDYTLRMAGFTPAGFDFAAGGVLKNGDRNKCVFNQADQTWYSWSGDLPYNVIGGSTPGEGWKVATNELFKNELSKPDSEILVGGVYAGTLCKTARGVKKLQSLPILDKTAFLLTSFYPDNDIGGGVLIYDGEKPKSDHNGGTVIAPEAITKWDGTLNNISQLLNWKGVGKGCFVRIEKRIDPAMFGAVDDVNRDSTKSTQAAIDACAKGGWLSLFLTGKYSIFSSLIVNRAIGNGESNVCWNVVSDEYGGLVCRFSGALFSSTIPQTTSDPVSQLIRFVGVTLSGDGNGIDRFIFDENKFLRIWFNDCTMNFIRCLNTAGDKYVQSYYFNSCNIRKNTGTFFSAERGYDIKVSSGTLIEAHGGDVFRIVRPIGCSLIGSTIEGVSGTGFDYERAEGLAFVGMYWEGNGRDIDGSNTNGDVSYGVANIGGYHSAAKNGYNIKWGPGLGLISAGNWGTGELHEFSTSRSQLETLVQDIGQTNLANADVKISGGVFEDNLQSLTIRTEISDGYTNEINYSNLIIRDGFVYINFVALLTSTKDNPSGKLYISSGLPFTTPASDVLCGNVLINGISHSPIITKADEVTRIISTDDIIPALSINGSVRVTGEIRYKIVMG